MKFKISRREIAFFHDVIVAGVALALAMILRLGWRGAMNQRYDAFFELGVPLFMVVAAIVFRFMGMYRGLWRYSSVPDLIAIFKGATLSVLVFFPLLFLINRLDNFPRTVPWLLWIILIMLLGGSRLLFRLLRDKFEINKTEDIVKRIPVLLYGAGDGAELFIRSSMQPSMIYEPIGIIDDDRHAKGRSIRNIPVLGGADNLDKILKRLKNKMGIVPQKIIVTEQGSGIKDHAPSLRILTESASKHGLTMGCLPDLSDLKSLVNDGRINLRPIAIEDLLGRPQKIANIPEISEFLKGKRVIVTGAGGSIGSEIVKQVASFNPEAMALVDNGEHNLYQIDMAVRNEHPNGTYTPILADVRNRKRIFQIFESFKPHVVFHAAAYKHVPMVEYNPSEGVLTNVIGTRNVADAAMAVGVEAMVQISTDKAVNPTNIMGATKRIAEAYAQALDLSQKGTGKDNHRGTRIMTVRFGNVLGSSGSVVPLFRKQLEKGGPLTVTDPNIERFFMTIPEAVGLVLSASAHGMTKYAPRGQIFVLDMGEPVKIVDIARQMIRLAGLKPDEDIKITFTGLRPGEKMYEELFDSGEELEDIGLLGVRAANPRAFDMDMLKSTIEKLSICADEDNVKDVVTTIGQVVPGFDHRTHQKI